MAYKLFEDRGTTGASGSLYVRGVESHTVQCEWSGGTSISAMVVDLEGSLDNSNWFDLATHTVTSGEISNESLMFHVVNKPVDYVRVVVDSFTTTGTLALDAWYQYGTEGRL